MKQGETAISNAIRIALSKLGARVFRNQRGKYRTEHGQWIETGLCNGASDLIGLLPVVITPEMVGQRFARFVAIEVKAAHGRLTEEQKRFLEFVRAAGGIAAICRSADEAAEVINEVL